MLIPDFECFGLRAYASVDAVPVPEPTKTFWVRLRFKATGHEIECHEKTALNRALLITLTRLRADVVETWESER